MQESEIVTMAEYSRRRSVSPTAVYKAVREGRINTIEGKIDVAAADKQWYANTRNPRLQIESNNDLSPAYDLQSARAKREYHEANLAEMRERQMAGELVELAQVRLAYTTLAAQFRASLDLIPDKLCTIISGESDPNIVHEMIQNEIDQALEDLAKMSAHIQDKLCETK